MVQEHPSAHCSNTGTEMIVDYSTYFTMYGIFQSRETLIKWAQKIGKPHGFMIVIKKSDALRNKKTRRVLLSLSAMKNTKEKK